MDNPRFVDTGSSLFSENFYTTKLYPRVIFYAN
jgi:hypothetical protein